MNIIFNIIFVINIPLALTIIFIERKNPTAILAWLSVLLFFPLGGFILYIFFGQNIHREKLFRHTVLEETLLERIVNNQKRQLTENCEYITNKKMRNYSDIIKLNLNQNRSILTQNNSIKIYTDGNDKFNDLINDIKNSKHHIHIQYYILRNDSTGKKLILELTKAAIRGVEVRLLYDAMGGRTLFKRTFNRLRKNGGKVSVFFPSRLHLINIRMNYRNHRKIVIIDGNTGYIGGYNIGNEYLGKSKFFGNWRDTHIRISGSSVLALQERFIMDWRYSSKEQISALTGFPYFIEHENPGKSAVQIVSSGPDEIDQQIKWLYIKMIQKAEKYIYIQTPYFVPDDALFETLKIASLSGIDVRLMIPNKPDHLFVYWATYAYVGELLKAGARCYIYEDGFLHAKTMVVDGMIATVGTANYDVRSFKLNFEVNAVIYDEKVAQNLAEIFKNDLNKSMEMTIMHYNKRRYIIRIKEAFSRLLSSIL
ncbi:MAG: cardiolipin synthase [Spirochaetes bacterium]|nr:cardiolipin synthase [Spirochaetota bacterium]